MAVNTSSAAVTASDKREYILSKKVVLSPEQIEDAREQRKREYALRDQEKALVIELLQAGYRVRFRKDKTVGYGLGVLPVVRRYGRYIGFSVR